MLSLSMAFCHLGKGKKKNQKVKSNFQKVLIKSYTVSFSMQSYKILRFCFFLLGYIGYLQVYDTLHCTRPARCHLLRDVTRLPWRRGVLEFRGFPRRRGSVSQRLHWLLWVESSNPDYYHSDKFVKTLPPSRRILFFLAENRLRVGRHIGPGKFMT